MADSPPSHLRFALESLAARPGMRLRAVSRFRVTDPVGGPPQPDYLNAVARFECSTGPRRALGMMLDLEQRRGRRRGVPDGPRTLDLDLLLFGGVKMDAADLVLPHPRMGGRRFVLEPLEEIAPRLLLDGRTPHQCLQDLPA